MSSFNKSFTFLQQQRQAQYKQNKVTILNKNFLKDYSCLDDDDPDDDLPKEYISADWFRVVHPARKQAIQIKKHIHKSLA